MKQLLIRFWHWLGRLLGLDTTTGQPGGVEGSRPPIVPPLTYPDLATGEPPRYAKSQSILTFQERKLYMALLHAVENRYQILAKVRLGDFVYLQNHPVDEKYHRNQVLCKHVDFLLCTNGFLAPLLVIELDDRSHEYPDAQVRDRFKDTLFSAVGLPILRLELQENYPIPHLRQQIEEMLAVGN